MNVEIANRLVQLRKKNGLSQESLAEKLGISRQAVSKWERAESSPDTDNLLSLAKLYNVSLDELLSTEQEPGPAETATPTDAGEVLSPDKLDRQDELYRKPCKNRHDKPRSPAHLLFAMLAAFSYVAIGVLYHIWHPTWLIFLLIPIGTHLLLWPFLVIVIYLCLGFWYNLWHPAWLLLLTIPLYFAFSRFFRRSNGTSDQ